MEKNPLVSVVIPVHNASEYLYESINSIINQSYSNIECILVNNNSTDDSLSICQSFQEKYPSKIKVFDIDGGKSGGARNHGLENAQGKYITFFDADDIFNPDGIYLLVSYIEKYQSDICIGGIELLLQNNEKKLINYYPEGILFETSKISIKTNYGHAKLYKKSFLDEFHIRFFPNILYDDSAFQTRCLYLSNFITIIPSYHSACMRYIIRETSSVAQPVKHFEDMIISVSNTLDQFEKDINNPHLQNRFYTLAENSEEIIEIWKKRIYGESKKIITTFYQRLISQSRRDLAIELVDSYNTKYNDNIKIPPRYSLHRFIKKKKNKIKKIICGLVCGK